MTKCYDIFEECALARRNAELIQLESKTDKEFHFQNWFQKRLTALRVLFEPLGRNSFPDFRLVEFTEGYEVKGLAYPGREANYDSNSQVPTGFHDGRQVFYVFGRYPADLAPYVREPGTLPEYPVHDLVICQGDFLNADHDYVHENTSVKGFGSYGDVMIRDRKMYVAPTPFALTTGTAGLATLIVPAELESETDKQRFQEVGRLVRVEAESLIVGYTFDLVARELAVTRIPNPTAGHEHHFIAYRLTGETSTPVAIVKHVPVLETNYGDETSESD